MANNAGNSLARGWMTIHVAYKDRLSEVHPDLSVAADAEIAIGAIGEFYNRRLHGVENRAELGVSMRRNRPFSVMIRMTRPASGCRGIFALGEELFMLAESILRGARLTRCFP